MRNLPAAIAIALMATQLLLIAYARTTPARYFCWAPFDMQTDYTLDVSLDGRKLSPQEIRARYRRPAKGTDNRSVQNLIDIIQLYEERYAGNQRAEIVMRYRINGKQEQTWTYPSSQ
jgi:hypothetical protein